MQYNQISIQKYFVQIQPIFSFSEKVISYHLEAHIKHDEPIWQNSLLGSQGTKS